MDKSTTLTIDEVIVGLEDLGIGEGDNLVIHSSLRRLGHVEGGAQALLDAILETIGSGANLMVPTFGYGRPPSEPCFDPQRTPAKTGAFTEVVRRRPDSVRSLHPTHSVAAIGPDAQALTRDHLAGLTFGRGSPLDLMAGAAAKVLLLGVSHTSNSMIHVGEEHAGVPKGHKYAGVAALPLRMPDGRIVSHDLDSTPSCSAAFEAVEYPLRKRGEITDARIGGALCKIMRGANVIRRVVEIVHEKPDVLLCTAVRCRACNTTRRLLAHRS